MRPHMARERDQDCDTGHMSANAILEVDTPPQQGALVSQPMPCGSETADLPKSPHIPDPQNKKHNQTVVLSH